MTRNNKSCIIYLTTKVVKIITNERLKKEYELENRLSILKFSTNVLNNIQMLEDEKREFEEDEILRSLSSEFKEKYFELIDGFNKASLFLVDKILEERMQNAAPCQDFTYEDITLE